MRRITVVACAIVLSARLTWAQQAVSDVSKLPLREIAARAPAQKEFALFITGDGGWASIDKTLVETLAEHGVAVVGLDSRAYLHNKRTPEQLAADMSRVLRHYQTTFDAARFVIVGYSRGADLAPFIVSRMPLDLRSNLDLVAMVGLGPRAGFEFHFVDIVRDVKRPDDKPTVPELAAIRGTPMICFYGADEKESGCRDAPADLVTRVELPGGHHFDGAYQTIADRILRAITR
jgi:type IV secretory pathway VirJ component